MPKYQLTNAADEDLYDLYSYAFVEFGEHRADAYFESLENCLQRLVGPEYSCRSILLQVHRERASIAE